MSTPTPESSQKKISAIVSTISTVFRYDPQLLFSDSFERIKQQLNSVVELIASVINDLPNYWIIYDIVIALIPIAERIIFSGYSDQILDFLLTLNQKLSSILIFCTSRYIPLRLQLFTTVCSAFANTEEPREKDADSFLQNFKNDLLQLQRLEESNVNGLFESITLCNGTVVAIADLFHSAFTTIELMAIHFNSSEEIVFERVGSSRKGTKRKPARPTKEEQIPQVIPPPPPHTIELIVNAFNSPLSKADYLSKYGQAAQAWTNPECQLAPSFLHRLIYSFLKAGNALEGAEPLATALPDDKIVQLAYAISTERWLDASTIIEKLPKDEISIDFQFYNEVALKIWKRFCTGTITDPMVLKGVLHVMVLSPSPCPMQTSMVALHYCWNLDELKLFNEAAIASEAALNVVEDYRDIFTIRKHSRVLTSTTKIPNKPLDQGYLLFEKWIECLHTDLLAIWIRSKLKYGLQVDTEAAKIRFAKEIEDTKKEMIKTKQLYGTLSIKQKETFDALLTRPFKPPSHSKSTEQGLIDHFKNNSAGNAILLAQMAFFRPKIATSLLEKARTCLSELEARKLPLNSPVLYANRTEIGFIYPYSTQGAKSVAIYGKETVGSTGLTLSNVALNGTGVKQDVIEPFIVNKLKPNTVYTFGFGAFDSQNELIDTITEPFSVSTCHSLSVELINSYLSSASYLLKDLVTFDISLTYLLNRFTNVSQMTEDHSYHQHLNPFNKFLIKSSTFSEPAPMLRSFSSSLMMAARLFSNKPLYATSFQKVAAILSQILQTYELTLQICNEIYAVIQPLLANTFHTRWIIHPLLFVVNTLKNNKQTSKLELHQSLAARCSFALESILVQLYQERQLSSFVMNSIIELPPNPSRTSFMMFSSKNQLLEANVNDPTLPLLAAEMFRTSPEKCYDDLFAKFKLDPQFPAAAVYIISSAHNAGYCQQGVTWCNSALDYIKSTLHENDEKQPQKKANSRNNSKMQQKKKPVSVKGKKNETVKQSADDAAEMMAANKIVAVWNKYQHRRANIAKFFAANKYRSALNLLLAMCLIETDQQLVSATTQETVRTSRKDKHPTKGRQSKHATSKRSTPSQEEDPALNDQSLAVVNALKRAIVIGNRSGESIVMQAAATFFRVYISTIQQGSVSFNILSPLMTSITAVLIRNLPLSEAYSQNLLRELLVFMLNDNQLNNIKINLLDACKLSQLSGQHLWIVSSGSNSEGGQGIPKEFNDVQSSLQKRDPAENQFYEANTIYQKAIRPNQFPNEPSAMSTEVFVRSISEIAIALQHKQKLSMSVCLLTKLAFALFDRNENSLATLKLCEALECHFRLVKAQDKVDQILKDETEESFYQKHSWAGCISIFVISSLISVGYSSDRSKAIQLSRLASFALSSLFCSSPNHPKKQIDYADFEPSEIVPGIDIFSQLDPQQPLLEPAPVQYMSIAISNLLSSMQSYEMYFEMFKPLSFARHFFRFITREKRGLARARLITVISCAQFGMLQPGMKVLNDFLTNYGEPRVTKEGSLYPANAKKILFEISEPPNSTTNLEAARTISAPTCLAAITQMYGSSITCHYVICVSRILQNIASCSDPSGSNASDNNASRQSGASSRGKHRRSHHGKKDNDAAANASMSQSVDSFDGSLKMADLLLNEILAKEFKPEQNLIKLELQLEKAQVFLKQWKWEDAINISQTVIKSNPTPPVMNSSFIDRSILHCSGLLSTATQIIAYASYNLHDYQNAEKVATPYIKGLLLIHKADLDGAVQLFTQIALHPPITAYHQEYILSVAQLASLFCYNHKLFDSIQAKLSQSDRNSIKPVDLITKLSNTSFDFFTGQLGMNEGRSFFIRETHLLVRLKHLESIVNVHFGGDKDPIELLAYAQNLMTNKCPYVAHGLSFLLNATCSRIQMQAFLQSTPTLIQYWNQDVGPLVGKASVSPEFVEKMTLLLHTMFSQAPDCVVHPASQQSILDFAILAGVAPNEHEKRLEQSLATLSVASSVRSSRRFIQSLIAQSPDTPPPAATCPYLLMNDNKDQKLRGFAAAYYAHVCSLDLPLFDTEILEMRTLLFFKCFEDQCAAFKSIQKQAEQQAVTFDAGQVVGQWYQVDAKIFKLSDNGMVDNITTTITGKSPTFAKSGSYSKSTRASTAMQSTRTNSKKSVAGNGASGAGGGSSANLKGSLYFFIGVVVDIEETIKKKPTKSSSNIISSDSAKMTPILLAAQLSDLKATSNEMAEVGIGMEEAARMESSEAQGDAPPIRESQDPSAGESSKRKRTRQTKPKTPETTQNVSLLKNQAQLSLKNAEIKWKLSLHKAEGIFNKSNRIIGCLVEQRNRWPTEVKMDNIEMANATTLSHFFNANYGINEKAPQLAEWLCRCCSTSTGSTTPQKVNQ